jgi:hypothetical protein
MAVITDVGPSGTLMEPKSAKMPPLSRTVIVKGIGGLGNRIFALLSAVLYAQLTARKVIVDWRDGFYAEPGTNAFPLLFRSGSVATADSDLQSPSVAPWMWRDRLHVDARAIYKMLEPNGAQGCPFIGSLYSFDPANLNHPEDVIVMWSSITLIGRMRRHLAGEWRAMDDEAINARLFGEHLRVHPLIAAHAAEIMDTWPNRPRIGVHVRHTDRTTNIRRLQRHLDAICLRQPEAIIFLSTDSAGVEKAIRRRYRGVLSVPKWFPTSGPLHTPKAPCPDRRAMAHSSLLEMSLLAGCDYLVMNTDSAFSQVAKLLWKGDRRGVVDVAPLAWLPTPLRDFAWRMRSGLRWAPWLWRARRRLNRQRARLKDVSF